MNRGITTVIARIVEKYLAATSRPGITIAADIAADIAVFRYGRDKISTHNLNEIEFVGGASEQFCRDCTVDSFGYDS